MKERPLLFSAPMIRALLDGRKTQTRRTIAGAPADAAEVVPSLLAHGGDLWDFRRHLDNPTAIRCPHGEPGDRLWVRETHAQFMVGEGIDRPVPQCVAYRATCDAEGGFDYANGRGEVMRIKVTKWTPSIFMPRWTSRITLEVAEVRVQRLQEISEDDARAEGVEPRVTLRKVYPSKEAADIEVRSYRDGFATLWDSINGKRSPWSSNPWVWCLTFRRLP